MQIINPNKDSTLHLLEQVRNVVESKFYRLRDHVLTDEQLSSMRHELRDACDMLSQASRQVEQFKREVENT